MTARDIQRRLIRDLYRKSFTVPNYTPRGWWECDIFEITKAGYMREYEIKLSRSDFKADAKKERRDWEWRAQHEGGATSTTRNKHNQIELRADGCPRQFFYVTPAGLLAPDELPEWAGLIEVMDNDGYVSVLTIKNAPYLHKTKLNPAIKAQAEATCYWRWMNLFLNGKHLTTNDENTEQKPAGSS